MWVKLSQGGRLLREYFQILSHRSGEPAFRQTRSPKFHELKIRFNHVLQLKKQPFVLELYPANRSRSCTSMVGHSVLHRRLQPFKNCFHGIFHKTCHCPLSRSVAPSTLFVLQLCADLTSALSALHISQPPQHDAPNLYQRSRPHRTGCRDHLPCRSSRDPTHGPPTPR